MTADVQQEPADVLDELAYVLHGQGCGEVCVCVDDARALLPTVQALIADAEKRAAARALREAADGMRRRAAGMSFAPKVHAQHEARLLDRSAAALDPSGAAEGAGR